MTILDKVSLFYFLMQLFSEKPLQNLFREIFSSRDANALRQQGIDDPDTIVTFSVKYYYTRQFAEVTDDIELYMDQARIINRSCLLFPRKNMTEIQNIYCLGHC